jgi:hypothetical protein
MFRLTKKEDKRLSDLMETFVPITNFDLLYSREEPEPHINFRPEPYKNDATPQHCFPHWPKM